MTPEMQAKIAAWQQAAIDGTLTVEAMQEAIKVLREDRLGSAIASDRARSKKAKAVVPSAEELLREMEGL